MKRPLLFLFFLLLGKVVLCQKMNKVVQFIFDSSYNLYAVTIKITEFEGKTLKVSIFDTLSQLKTAEFLRISDGIYFYQSYNQNGKATTEGKAILDKTPFRKLKSPFFNKNGEQDGFLSWDFYKFHKSGRWYEAVNDSTDRYGSYENNKKTGAWFYTRQITSDKGVPERKEIYKTDSVIKTESLNLLEGSESAVLKEVCGKWEIMNSHATWFSDTILYYRKIPVNKKPDFRNYIIISPAGKGMIFIGEHGRRKYDFDWRFFNENRNIMIKIPDLLMKCKITFLSKEMLVGFFNEYRIGMR